MEGPGRVVLVQSRPEEEGQVGCCKLITRKKVRRWNGDYYSTDGKVKTKQSFCCPTLTEYKLVTVQRRGRHAGRAVYNKDCPSKISNSFAQLPPLLRYM
jgi:hypothetical protein